MTEDIETHLKIAVAMRAVRGALGLSQAEFAELIGVSKPTVARAETLEVALRLGSYSKMMKALKKIGVNVDALHSDSVCIEFEPLALESLQYRLSDQGRRRRDRLQSGIGLMQPGRVGKAPKDESPANVHASHANLSEEDEDKT